MLQLKRLKLFILIIMDIVNLKCRKIKIFDTKQTLDKIYNEKKSISRFGDGEFNLILNENISFQNADEKIKEYLKNILSDYKNNKNCLIAIPYTFHSIFKVNIKSMFFWIKYYAINRKNILPYLNKNYFYYDSQITRIYINRKKKSESIEYFNLWKKIWNFKNLLIVEGTLSRFGVGNDLLSNCKSIKRILCPPKNAFDCYDKIKTAILNQKEIDLIILVLGPTATVLAYDISQLGIQVLDCGNMDMEYEWMKINAKNRTLIKEKFTVEVDGGMNVLDCSDKEYLAQIILRIDEKY